MATAPTPAAPAMARAVVHVILPDAQARVWIADHPTVSTGMERQYQSPLIATGAAYEYTVRITWMESGREVTRQRTIVVIPGQTTVADFRQATAAKE
jgi:uncharacterized protein (TIGR03000 family)